MPKPSSGRRSLFAVAILVVLALVAVACGSSNKATQGASPANTAPAASAEGTPTPGGKLVYGLEAESSGGFCLSTAQLAASGIQEVSAIYDTLTVPNDKGEIVPYLAKAVTPNADYKEWTISLRDGVKFHDGTPLNADAVKLNLDQYRKGPLFQFVFKNVADTIVVDPLTLKVTMTVPWIAFPWFLFASGRAGIMAPAQFNDTANCPRKLIGTGPFKLKEWVVNDHLTGTKNPDYWRKAQGLPYLDEIEFRPVPDEGQRLNGLKAGQLDLMHTTSGQQIDILRRDAKAKTVNLVENQRSAEVSYTMLNVSKPPFDDIRARQAMAYARNIVEINNVINKGVNTLTDQPFAPDVLGYVKDPGFPKFDLAKAKQLVADYEKDKGPLRVTISFSISPEVQQLAQLIKSQLEQANVKVDLRSSDQATLINQALGADFQATLWRNHPGGDPDTQYVWWYGGSPVNFNKFNDPEINRTLDQGRSEPDKAKREALYQELPRRFAQQVYNIWGWYSLWSFASKPAVKGVGGPELPEGGRPGLVASYQPTVGLWIKK